MVEGPKSCADAVKHHEAMRKRRDAGFSKVEENIANNHEKTSSRAGAADPSGNKLGNQIWLT